MNSYLLAFKSGFGFLSTIPVGISMEGIDELMKKIYFYPVVGAVLGLLIGAIAYIGQIIFPGPVLAALIMGFIYYITGFNHLDGVTDMGDGFMAHGSREKKLKALKDTTLGTGGAAFCMLLLLALYGSIRAIQEEGLAVVGPDLPVLMFGSMFIAEVSAKQSMLTIAAFGKPIPPREKQAYPGLGTMTINGATRKNFLIGFVFGAVVCFLPFGWIGLLAYLGACISALVILNRSYAHFGGLNGDGIGTANEIGRVTALTILAVILKLSLNGHMGGLEWTLL
ncbi:MAG: adenosylcobinamide-GDP ribazoletransferase [Methanosarcina flavescens]|jgi:adenosylcobinamide-GDP ribazoletransferase|uniref:Adenosylcobinamide-GDP ribazoletransferase n=1 Tax=Methanosarcina flavescens TaxID=1715806 RepID=A0A660HRQ4_9EURY|nr:adenosylcobinamide-GDP ribazoletransferase [Methanosarcina flavescens]AYK14746.1 adenosylcobinamide-GDP ribazoletransferase [Methanosarcina flavescens]NLK33392.1 adenosylcobinamide-GDP ribazoletransferase [Methanosarcina flavescens]